ncbi:hypothetical protein KIN20_027925 [Parelaphostrongylus tenuis]|uniref:Uncharacterized protein n=1 Tax=Parelaphostrongylus tenuis TaxID=148309 RepID=A0AAD5M9R2_PARTN|nr:hypothetical protein KIN20_008389 [Parelaphostrongylus tenuis]KAJ1364215.1 hypothetical protein KIN20_024246 [Parelaphostrongylus tenuis]KAJ1367071.1 hypothetical protein KIN20_027920 [Parelaphostrongylus tenuis]KAJ1367076.1 hypothetical protein KIN20_027925 [Parelaphostrongylus tenuis]
MTWISSTISFRISNGKSKYWSRIKPCGMIKPDGVVQTFGLLFNPVQKGVSLPGTIMNYHRWSIAIQRQKSGKLAFFLA